MQQQQQQQGQGRLAEYFNALTLGCRSIIIVCLSVFIYTFLTDTVYAICPAQVYQPEKFWAMLVVPSFVHLGVLHILFNMMTLVAVGVPMEKRFGTICFLGLVMLFTLAGNITYLLLNWLLVAFVDTSYLRSCAAGFSGVLFSLIVLDARSSPNSTRSIFGFFTVPNWLYPWVLMLFIQILMPGVSLIGHLSGALIGTLYSLGLFSWLTLSSARVRSLESKECIQSAFRMSCFATCPETSPMQGMTTINTGIGECLSNCWGASCGACIDRLRNWRRSRTSRSPDSGAGHWQQSQGFRLGGQSNPYGELGDEFDFGEPLANRDEEAESGELSSEASKK